MPMTFQELQIGDYFRIPGISSGFVYRKASDSHCGTQTLVHPNSSILSLLQPIRPEITVIPLTSAETKRYFAAKQADLESLK
jgi:hypothetical protein